MTIGLSPSRIVAVSVTLTPNVVPARNFGASIVIGSSDVIDTNERYREYNDITAVADDFGTTAPEYKAALLHFSQSPQPVLLYIGRWAQNASKGLLRGAILTSAQQALSNFQAITAGSFKISIDGIPTTITNVNLSTCVNLPAVAFVLQTTFGVYATVTWNNIFDRFEIRSATSGPTSSVSYAATSNATNFVVFTTNPIPTNIDIVINYNALQAVAGSPNLALLQYQAASTLAATLANLAATINANPTTMLVTAVVQGSDLLLTAIAPGAAGNGIRIGTGGGATLSDGTNDGTTLYGIGQDVGSLLGLTQDAGASPPVAGIIAETLTACVATLADKTNDWYAASVATLVAPTTADTINAALFIEAAAPARIFGVTETETFALDPNRADDLGSQFKALNLSRTFSQYSTSNPYAVVSLFARMATTDFNAQNSTIIVMFKTEPGIVAENLTATEADALKAKNVNVFANYQNGAAIIQYGTMANGDYLDERQGLDWYANELQTDVFNLFLISKKIPQTDDGMNLIATTIDFTNEKAVNNGLFAPGVWQADGFGTLANGDVLPRGYYTYVPPVSGQSPADRKARVSVPYQIAAKLAGGVQEAIIGVSVNR